MPSFFFCQVGKFLKIPVVKFVGDALSHMAFVILIILYSVNEYASGGLRFSDLSAGYENYGQHCSVNATCYIEDMYVRSDSFGATASVLVIFVAGKKTMWQSTSRDHYQLHIAKPFFLLYEENFLLQVLLGARDALFHSF